MGERRAKAGDEHVAICRVLGQKKQRRMARVQADNQQWRYIQENRQSYQNRVGVL